MPRPYPSSMRRLSSFLGMKERHLSDRREGVAPSFDGAGVLPFPSVVRADFFFLFDLRFFALILGNEILFSPQVEAFFFLPQVSSFKPVARCAAIDKNPPPNSSRESRSLFLSPPPSESPLPSPFFLA